MGKKCILYLRVCHTSPAMKVLMVSLGIDPSLMDRARRGPACLVMIWSQHVMVPSIGMMRGAGGETMTSIHFPWNH